MADRTTIETYDNHAQEFADYFRSIKTGRVDDVAKAFELLGAKLNPNVVEIGCGDGRDAAIILGRTKNFTGFDPSQKLVELAKKNLPDAKFEISDALDFDYPNHIDVVFAFASLIHVSLSDMKEVFAKVHDALNVGGIFYISLKASDTYHEFLQEGKFGRRLFYFYNPNDIRKMAQKKFEEVYFNEGFVTNGAKNWFEIAFKKA